MFIIILISNFNMEIWLKIKNKDLRFIKILHIKFQEFPKYFHIKHYRWKLMKMLNFFSFLLKQMFNFNKNGLFICTNPNLIYNLNISKHMTSHNSRVSDNLFIEVVQVSNDEYNHSNVFHQSNNLKPNQNPTQAHEEENHHLISASRKPVPRDYQISFQAEFMSEHKDAFIFQLKNFMESSFKYNRTGLFTFQSSEIFGEQLDFGSFTNQESILEIFQDKSSLIGEIKKFQKLNSFLEFVFETLPVKVASQILYLIQFGMEKYKKNLKPQQNQFTSLFGLETENYLNMNSSSLTSNECIENSKVFAEEFCKNQTKSQKLIYLSFTGVQKSELNEEKEVNNSFRKFIEFLFSTMIFLIEQFFENPYGQSSITKRERVSFEDFYEINDSEQQSSSTDNIKLGKPMKRMH